MPTKKVINRKRRHKRVRSKIKGTSARPRLNVFRSVKHIYAQLIDDTTGQTLVASSDVKIDKGTKREKALAVGKEIASKAIEKKIETCVFDRGGFIYHGRVKNVAEAAREAGLKF